MYYVALPNPFKKVKDLSQIPYLCKHSYYVLPNPYNHHALIVKVRVRQNIRIFTLNNIMKCDYQRSETFLSRHKSCNSIVPWSLESSTLLAI
jgi:hypothetical protein